MASHLLAQLAQAYGISTSFTDWKGNYRQISDYTITACLAAFDVKADTDADIEQALADKAAQYWLTPIAPVKILRQGQAGSVDVHVDEGADASVQLILEDQSQLALSQIENNCPAFQTADRLIGEASFALPGDLPLGYHELVLTSQGQSYQGSLIVVPNRLELPAKIADHRIWGYQAQLYSVRSEQSWAVGDFADLADLATWAGSQGSDYLLVNPLHASQPVAPLDDSPYLPTSRLFWNPIYIRPERIAEYCSAPDEFKAGIAAQKQQLSNAELLDRSGSWTLKRACLEQIYQLGRSAARQIAFEFFKQRKGSALTRFAAWSLCCEFFGTDWRSWPEGYQQPDTEQVTLLCAQYPAKLDFYCWLQWVADQQLSDAQQAAKDNSMASGVVTDLAVGVGAGSADTWLMSDAYAHAISVGAPPDAYNQLGQSWGQPPLRPDKLAAKAYLPFRELIRNALSHAGGVRIDHILGMFRLWWIPAGGSPQDGCYVRNDHEAMIGIILLEAQRAGAFVIGEDLGTMEDWVRGYLNDRGVMGTSVLWFENGNDGRPIAAANWRPAAMASVVTHDLPPTAGYLTGEHVRLRNELRLLTEPLETELGYLRQELCNWAEILSAAGFLTLQDLPNYQDGWPVFADQQLANWVFALYRYLASTSSQILNVALVDAALDKRVQNQPGTWLEYPNWRVPLSDINGKPVLLEQLYATEFASKLAELLNGGKN